MVKTIAIIAGGRKFRGTKEHEMYLHKLAKKYNITMIYCGMCRGGDMFGYNFAKSNDICIISFPADWNKYGNVAGPIRNREMALALHNEPVDTKLCILFPGEKGTADMRRLAFKYGFKVFNYPSEDPE